MITIEIQQFSEISSSFDGFLLDAYGVFWGGNESGLIEGSKEAMQSLVASGKSVGILSNTTQLVSKEKEKLKRYGLNEGEHFHFLITSGEIAKEVFCKKLLSFACPKGKFWIHGAPHPKFSSPLSLFEESEFVEAKAIEDADFIYLAIPHVDGKDQLDISIFKEEMSELVKTGLPLVCANPDHFAHEGNPPILVVRQGSLAAIYEQMGGQVFYIGKPSNLAYEKALNSFAERGIKDKQKILMIGDTPETDIRGARSIGIPAALVMTGIMKERIIKEGFEKAFLRLVQNDFPNFLIEGLK